MGEASRKREARQKYGPQQKQGERRALDVNTGELSEVRQAEITPTALLRELRRVASAATTVPCRGCRECC